MAGVSQNNWPLDPGLRAFNVPGTSVNLQLVANVDAATCLVWAAWVVHNKVARLDPAQCGGYDKRPIGALGGTTSNHRSGTAIDLNWSQWPQGARKYTTAQQQVAHAIVSACEGVLRWGGDYGGGSLVDEMHYEINTTNQALIARVAAKLRGGGNSATTTGGSPTQFSSPDALVSPSGSAASSAPEKKVLPPIGPAAEHAVIPLTGAAYFDSTWNRLAQVRVNGGQMTGDLVTAVQSVQMSYSASQVGQFSMTLADDGWLLSKGILVRGASIDFADQHLELRALSYSPAEGGLTLTVKARARVISVLRGAEHTGPGSWGEMDVAQWVKDRCREAGAIAVVQDGLGSATFNRQEYDTAETTWDVMQRIAKQVGAWCYEFEQVITFMRPTALAARSRARWWELTWTSPTDYTNGIAGPPAYSASDDSSAGESLQVQLISGDAAKARPGDGLTLHGNVGPAAGDWVITQVDDPVTNTKPVAVTCSRIVDPEPQAVIQL